jgi:hypothetical protein
MLLPAPALYALTALRFNRSFPRFYPFGPRNLTAFSMMRRTGGML